MKSEEKARELVDRFDLPTGLMSKERKQCALICCSEILEFYKRYEGGIDSDEYDEQVDFWKEVKKAIEKL